MNDNLDPDNLIEAILLSIQDWTDEHPTTVLDLLGALEHCKWLLLQELSGQQNAIQ